MKQKLKDLLGIVVIGFAITVGMLLATLMFNLILGIFV